jgi:hypothetical protein
VLRGTNTSQLTLQIMSRS